jgi:hypothetical protein
MVEKGGMRGLLRGTTHAVVHSLGIHLWLGARVGQEYREHQAVGGMGMGETGPHAPAAVRVRAIASSFGIHHICTGMGGRRVKLWNLLKECEACTCRSAYASYCVMLCNISYKYRDGRAEGEVVEYVGECEACTCRSAYASSCASSTESGSST